MIRFNKLLPFLSTAKILFALFFLLSSSSVLGNSRNLSASNLILPPFLKKGDTILILAPAGKIKSSTDIQAGVDLAKKWGLVVTFGKHLYSVDNSFAGSDLERLSDFQIGLDNPNIKMIWPARGGYGTIRIIDDLNFDEFKKNPKWIVGYSDVTVLHSKIHNLGFQSIHGQMPSTLNIENDLQQGSINSLYKVLFGKQVKYKLPSHSLNIKGKSKGVLIGGNLSILYSMLGSETNIDTTDKILFIEDVGEYIYHVDRMLISLKRAGLFKNIKGLIVGDFKLKENKGNPFGKTLEEVVLKAIKGTNIPVVFNFPAGHLDDNNALQFGNETTLNVTEKKTIIAF